MLSWFDIYSAVFAAFASWSIAVATLKTAIDLYDKRQSAQRWLRIKAYLTDCAAIQPKTREQLEDIASKHGLRIDEHGNLQDGNSPE